MIDKNIQTKKTTEDRNTVDFLFQDYRKSGLTLMTTVIGLSSGGFFGLFQIDLTREISFLYLIPITIALMQQLTYYLGSKSSADSKLNELLSNTEYVNPTDKQVKISRDAQVSHRYSNFYFGISDVFCALAAISLGLVTIWPMALFSSSLVGIVFSVSISCCLGYWAYRRFQIYSLIKNTDW